MIRSEMRDSYDPTVKGFAVWQATGDTRAQEWGDHLDVVRAAAARGVRIGRVRVVSEPLSEYLRWEHACTDVNISAGEDIRWLRRTKAATCCCPAPIAGCSTSGSCGGTSNAAMARTRITTPSAQIPAPSATS